MDKKTGKKSTVDFDIIDFELIKAKKDIEELIERECPICRAPIVGPKPFCLACGSRLLRRKADEKDKIVVYFNQIHGIMEQSRKSIEKDEVRTKLSVLDDRIRKNPEDEESWFKKGILLNIVGADKKALNAFNAALEIDDGYSSAWIAKAYVLTRLMRFSEASNCYRNALETVLKKPQKKRPARPGKAADQVSLITPKIGVDQKGRAVGLTNGLTNGMRERMHGVINGFTNGLTNGLTTGIRRGRRGLTNGLTNGLKRTRLGLTNGIINGLTNGITNGLTNGLRALKIGITNGVTNGNGITNGLGGVQKGFEEKSRRIRLLAIPIALMFLFFLPSIINMFYTSPQVVDIDGSFTDWNGIVSNSDTQEAAAFNQNVDIIDYRVYKEPGFLSFYLEVEGKMMAGQPEYLGRRVDTAHIFIDTDQEYSSGYQIKGIGADYMMRIYGWKGKVHTAELYSFSDDDQDWNNWEHYGQANAMAKGSGLELQVQSYDINLKNGRHADAYFHMQSWDGFEDFSDTIVSGDKGVLLVKQQGVGRDVISGNGNRLLRLEMQALNADITLTELTATRTGKGSDSDVGGLRLENDYGNTVSMGMLSGGKVTFQPNLLLSKDQNRILYIVVDVSITATHENSVGFKIQDNHDVVTYQGTTSLERLQTASGLYDNSYILAIPDAVKVDGAFADWADKISGDDTTDDVRNENLDIIEYGVSNTTQEISFYLKVDGEIDWGDPIPYRNTFRVPGPAEPSEPGEPSPVTPVPPRPPRTGEDIAYIYIDSDNLSSTGYSIGDIGADHLIEVKGKYGEIISKRHLSFSGPSRLDWEWIYEGIIDAETDTARLETQISKGNMDITGHFKVYFQTTDWNGSEDDYSTDKISRGFPRIIFRGTRYSSDILVCGAGSTPTIDGNYNSAEWSDANSVTNGDLTVYVKMDATYVYFAVTTADTSVDSNDICAIYFETDHANDGVDDSYDKKIQTRYVGIWFDEWYEGTGSGWPAFGESPPPANHIIAENLESGVGMEYEAQVPRSTLNDANNFDEDHEKIGFAVIVLDAGSAYEEWPDGALDEPSGNSNSWGELEIPEFREVVLPVSGVVFFYLFWRRGRGQSKTIEYRATWKCREAIA